MISLYFNINLAKKISFIHIFWLSKKFPYNFEFFWNITTKSYYFYYFLTGLISQKIYSSLFIIAWYVKDLTIKKNLLCTLSHGCIVHRHLVLLHPYIVSIGNKGSRICLWETDPSKVCQWKYVFFKLLSTSEI